jgi:molecular chaperone IbpA|tara:strand:- start:172 stop:633 length:462 start_codon:yes stop_codon:yes gene_type:complete
MKMVRNNLNVPRSLFVGFDTLFEDLERIHQSARSGTDNYPPHNIVRIDEEKFLIELAVAGFKEDGINVEVKDGILKVTGEMDKDERDFAFKGISSRKFEKSFRLSEFVVIDGADLKDGILVVYARVELPEEKRPRKIEIGSAGASKKKQYLKG